MRDDLTSPMRWFCDDFVGLSWDWFFVGFVFCIMVVNVEDVKKINGGGA